MAPDITSKLQALTPQHQQTILAFIEFLAAQEASNQPVPTPETHPSPAPASPDNWQADPFFGIWRDRSDLQDSTAWIKQMRQQHWSR